MPEMLQQVVSFARATLRIPRMVRATPAVSAPCSNIGIVSGVRFGDLNRNSLISITRVFNGIRVFFGRSLDSKPERVIVNVMQKVQLVSKVKPPLVRLQAGVLESTMKTIKIQAATRGCTVGEVVDAWASTWGRLRNAE